MGHEKYLEIPTLLSNIDIQVHKHICYINIYSQKTKKYIYVEEGSRILCIRRRVVNVNI